MMTLVPVCCLVAAVSAVSFNDLVREEWTAFKLQYKKKYDGDFEESFRMKIFADNQHRIALHNQRYAQGLVSFKLGLNKYADLLHHEFINTLNGFNMKPKPTKVMSKVLSNVKHAATYIAPAHVEIPNTVDWRKEGAVTPVKDQGSCGSSWAFSATGALEGQHFRKTGVLVSLSEQNLIDCSTVYGNTGCNGGHMNIAFKYIDDIGGIEAERSYPYKAKEDKCRHRAQNISSQIVGFTNIPEGDEEKLKLALATVGPVSVAIDASQESFQLYSRGMYNDLNCKNTNLNHAVLVVGYGTDSTGRDYWLLKNSWGSSWGEEGYFKIPRNRTNHCGVATAASYPLV